jgi:hypothetical protein
MRRLEIPLQTNKQLNKDTYKTPVKRTLEHTKQKET